MPNNDSSIPKQEAVKKEHEQTKIAIGCGFTHGPNTVTYQTKYLRISVGGHKDTQLWHSTSSIVQLPLTEGKSTLVTTNVGGL